MAKQEKRRREVYKQCASKRRYPNENIAQHEADKATEARGVLIRFYECDTCFGFHLTKAPFRP